jgi:hypothetical protein
MGAWLAMMVAAPQLVATVENGAIRVRAVRSGGEIVEELSARDKGGAYRTILVSPTHPMAGPRPTTPVGNLIRGSESGLFDAAPTFRFATATVSGNTLKLTSTVGPWSVTKLITLPAKGNIAEITLSATTQDPYPQVRYFLNSYAFAPGKPDETWAPGLRPNDGDVIGDHFFRAPAAILRKGSLAATVMPDLDVLAENRPIPTILDLDVKSAVVPTPIVSYGFADHRLAGHVRFSHDASMVRPTPWELKLHSQIRLDADASVGSPVNAAAGYMWERYGHRYFDKVLPQVMPFADYARLCYPAAFNEKMTGGWFQRTIDGQVCGGVPSGWGLTDGWVSWQCWFNQLRSAWGLRWWGKKLGEADWVDKADKMLNLALAAPMNQGACPTTYLSKTNEWRGSLIMPTPDCYYDIPSIAWKGIWLARWSKLPDCPRRDEVRKQMTAIRDLMVRIQRPDGSFPSWLTKELKVAAPLDRSAQGSLPVWFLQEYVDAMGPSSGHDSTASAIDRGAQFLMKNVVDQRRYYDFETFFSCSPKPCRQLNGLIDDVAMWDPHSMQPPQNTLCMQWSAEAIHRAKRLNGQAQALNALDTMAMYQNVWPISYRKAAYTYGGFGVQNSDGEYNDARQAQFGVTLCDFGAQLGRRDLFERGVAAVRASLTLVNVPGDPYGVYPNPNYPPGLEPENTGHGGTDQQDGRTGFDWGEGSGLAAAAELIDRYGETYKGNGWDVRIDATPPPPAKPVPLSNPQFDFTDPRMPGWTIDATFLNWPTRSTRMDFNRQGLPFIGTCEDGHGGFDDSFTGSMISPPFTVTGSTIRLLVGGGSGNGVGVELLDANGKRVAVARGANEERMREVTWPVTNSGPYRIRIFDEEKEGWGHINVGRIRT